MQVVRWQGPRPPYRPRPAAELRAGIREHPPAPACAEQLAHRKPNTLSRLGIAGGAVCDALVALAAKEHGAALATRDARARGTYDAVGVAVIVVT